MHLATVITADFVHRTESSLAQKTLSEQSQLVFGLLSEFLESESIVQPFRISRGDSFQGVLAGAQRSLKAALYLRLQLRSVVQLDLRQAVGIGPVEELVGDSPLESSGTAFLRSGRLLDEMSSRRKPHQRISVHSGDPDFDAEFFSQLELLEAIYHDWTDKEAEAILFRMQQWTQSEIAEHLSIDQSAVNRRLKAAHWDAVVVLLNRWEQAAERLVEIN